MSIAAAYTTPALDALVGRFAAGVSGVVGSNYCRGRRNEFVLQQMLLPGVLHGVRYRSALDVGCGVGFKSLLLSALADQVRGIDLATPYHGFAGDEPAAVFGQRVLDRIGCTAVSLHAVGVLEDDLRRHRGAFDLVVSDYLVEHVQDVAALHQAIFDALERGGVVVHAVPNTHEAIDRFVRVNTRSSWRDYARAVRGLLRPGRRDQKITLHGTLVPITHSEFTTTFDEQLDVYRIEHNVFAMIEAGFEVLHVVPTREHTYTVVARRPLDS